MGRWYRPFKTNFVGSPLNPSVGIFFSLLLFQIFLLRNFSFYHEMPQYQPPTSATTFISLNSSLILKLYQITKFSQIN